MELLALLLIVGGLEEETLGGRRSESARYTIIDHGSNKNKIKSLYPDSSERQRDPTKNPG